MLTIVMYHYVRDVERTPFPGIKARSLADFAGQLDYLERHYEPVGAADVRAALAGGRELPPRACLLTFDDGLVDHRDAVAPALRARGLPACFAVSAAAVLERRLAEVHKSQFILAAEPDRARLVDRIFAALEPTVGGRPGLSPGTLRELHARPGRFDDAETMLAKRLLQDGLPDDVRRPLVDGLFAELVSDDERAFADALYVTLDDVRGLAGDGMEIAGHGVEHLKLGTLAAAAQRREIAGTTEFLELVHGRPPRDWTMCFPSGSFDAITLALLEQSACALGLTDSVGLVGLDDSPLALPRLDTNDLPVRGDAAPAAWTVKAG